VKHPPYHLRPNKAIDRLLLIEAINRLERLSPPLSDYTYYGLGGPYLEDFRLIYEFCAGVKMVSIEEDREIYNRQRFHLPCATLRLEKDSMGSFLTLYQANDNKSIFWLDYSGRLKYQFFTDFMVLLTKLPESSLVKITLPCDPKHWYNSDSQLAENLEREFGQQFASLMPNRIQGPPRRLHAFALLTQQMIRVAAEKALPSSGPTMFHPLCSFFYSDGTGMFTLTGVICDRQRQQEVKEVFSDLPFYKPNWSHPRHIDVPILSTRERLHLQGKLPCNQNAGNVLRKQLGYLIDKDADSTEKKLKQYATFHKYYPYFMRAVP